MINLSIPKYKDREGLGVRKRINTTVKSTYQSLIHVECFVHGQESTTTDISLKF